jgi:hypothetical protein
LDHHIILTCVLPAIEGAEESEQTPQSFGGLPTGRFFRALAACGISTLGQLHFFPSTTVYRKAKSPFWYKITFSPDAPGQTTVWCDVYASKYSSAFRFEGAVKDRLEEEMKAKVKELEEVYAKFVETRKLPEDNGKFPIAENGCRQ